MREPWAERCPWCHSTYPFAQRIARGHHVGTLGGGSKPIYITRPGSTDPVEHSVADTLFSGDIMMEHALFFAMLMPGEDLKTVGAPGSYVSYGSGWANACRQADTQCTLSATTMFDEESEATPVGYESDAPAAVRTR